MTATDELHRLLDERGVEWMPSVWSAKDETFYKVGEVGYLATEMSSGRMKVGIEGYLTPEQAIEATLGSAELRKERDALDHLTDVLNATNDGLLAENAKLRELVRDVMPIVCDGCHERLCEMPKEEHPFVTCSFADRMRELGVDV